MNDKIPVLTRFSQWASGVVRGDLGRTIDNESVNDELGRRMWVSLRLLLIGSILGTVLGVAAGLAAARVILALPAIVYNIHGSPVGLGELLRGMARPLGASLLAGAILIGMSALLPAQPAGSRLVVASLVFGVSYLGCWLAIPGGVTAARETLAALRDLRPTARS